MSDDKALMLIPAIREGVRKQRRLVRLDLIRHDGMVVTLNSTGTVIGELIDGKTSIEKILEHLECLYVVDRERLKEHLLNLVHRLVELEYVSIENCCI